MSDVSESETSSKYVSSSRRRKTRSGRRVLKECSSDSGTDSSMERPRKRRKPQPVPSDDEDNVSDSPIFKKNRRRPLRVSSGDNMSSNEDDVVQPFNNAQVPIPVNGSYSDSDETNSDENDNAEEDSCSSNEAEADSEEEEIGGSESLQSDGSFSSSDWESDWESEPEDSRTHSPDQNVGNCKVEKEQKNTISKSAEASNDKNEVSSDSSDGQSEKCPICLMPFTSQEVGTPESCDHVFCAECLQVWSRNVNTCPVDRQVFTLILIRKHVEGKVIRRIPVEQRQQVDEGEELDEDPTFCEICHRCDREDRMLLCDGCDQGYHLECLDPPMSHVPIEEWFCPDCASNNSNLGEHMAETVEIQDGEVFELLSDLENAGFVPPIRPRVSRLLPRTRHSERVRATIRVRQQTRPSVQVLFSFLRNAINRRRERHRNSH